MKKGIVVLFMLLVSASTMLAQKTTYKNESPVDFQKMMAKKKGVLIDLRTPDEIKKGKIKGATEIDFLAVDFEREADKLDKKKTYYVYCAGGGRSADAAEILTKKGFKNVVNLTGGFSAWKKANLEIEQKQ